MKFNILFTFLIILSFLFVSCGESDLPEVEVEADQLVIADAQTTDFYIIRSDFADDAEVKTVVRLRKALLQESGAEFGISTDWEKNPVYPHEIIVGETLREGDSPIDRIDLGKTGYIIKEENGKIFIAGGSDEGTSIAVDYFISNFVKGETISLPVGYEKVVHHQYAISDLYIDMCKIDNSRTIYVPNTGKTFVSNSACNDLRDVVYERTGIWLNITNSIDDGVPAFVLSNEPASANGTHEITVANDQLVFTSSAETGLDACIRIFIDEYLSGKTGRINFPGDFRYFDLGDFIIVNYPDE